MNILEKQLKKFDEKFQIDDIIIKVKSGHLLKHIVTKKGHFYIKQFLTKSYHEIRKEEQDEIIEMIDKEIERWEKEGTKKCCLSSYKISALYDLRKQIK